jgi:hypothetical protein
MLREYRSTLCPGGLYEWGREAQKDNSMTDELKKRMARLRELAPRLNTATDQASRVVAMVEKFLVDELHIGISAESTEFNAWNAGKDEDGNSRMAYQKLAFGRLGAGYRIHVVDETTIVDDEGHRQDLVSKQATPWPSCGRETKMRAIEKLPELLDKIIQETERLAETAGETASRIGAMIGDSKGPAAPPPPQVAPQVLACQGCGEKGTWLNVGPEHWCVCVECELKWPIGTNLVPSWLDESEEVWKRNAKLLAEYSAAE